MRRPTSWSGVSTVSFGRSATQGDLKGQWYLRPVLDIVFCKLSHFFLFSLMGSPLSVFMVTWPQESCATRQTVGRMALVDLENKRPLSTWGLGGWNYKKLRQNDTRQFQLHGVSLQCLVAFILDLSHYLRKLYLFLVLP